MELTITKGDLSPTMTEYIKEVEPLVAIDIETDGLDWHGKIGLVTVYVEGYGTELVHLPDRSLWNLRSICFNKRVKKVFHHAPFDMRFLMYWCGARFQNVECTRIAGVTLDSQKKFKHSLVNMVDRFLGVTLEKGQALSDWFKPELDADQIRYAAEDVKYLPALLYTTYGRMAVEGSLPQFKDACAYLPSKCYYEILGVTDVYGR